MTPMYDEDLTNLEDSLRRLKVEYDIFFNGHRKRPPEDLKMRVEKLVKRMAEVSNMTYAQRFRYTTLVTRFYVFRDVWRRTLTERESGERAKEEGGSPASKARSPKTNKAAGEMRVSISNPEQEAEKVRQLYDAMLGMRKMSVKQPSTAPSYEQFAKYIATQTQGIRGKYNCPAVVFTLSLQEDAIRFTARAEETS